MSSSSVTSDSEFTAESSGSESTSDHQRRGSISDHQETVTVDRTAQQGVLFIDLSFHFSLTKIEVFECNRFFRLESFKI
ncbi:unnamed protein product [Onchocerca flexuosa]|uniref:Uncharacterized protein n=1 Tax=Onchocerca flexuosa TaxID=387005 RepID=A0A183HKX0_9BILA|nr:unnamed protein product [Onchocerca flexuosa]